MSEYFKTKEAIHCLEMEAEEWIGTPFVPRAQVKKGGADCVGLVAGIYIQLGVLQKFEPMKYTLDEGRHLGNSKILGWFDGRLEFNQIFDLKDLQPGDAIVMRLNKVEHHIGLVLPDGKFIHTLEHRFAMLANLSESLYSRRITAIFRPVKLTP